MLFSQRFRWFLGFCTLGAMVLPAGDVAVGQEAPAGNTAVGQAGPAGQYRQLPVEDALKTETSRVRNILRNGKVAGADKDLLDGYYKKYGFARWSLPENYHRLPGFRKELVNDFRMSKDGSREYLNDLCLTFFEQMASVDVHPAVRYNAMLVIASLNTKDPDFRDNAVPLEAALPVLLKAVQNEQQIDAVKIAALRGIWRHAALGIPNEQNRNAVIQVASELAAAKIATGRTAAGHAWMRRRAIDILGMLGIPGENSETAKLLADIISQQSNPPSVRLAASDALGRLKATDETQVDTAATAVGLGKLALEVCKSFSDEMQEEVDRRKQERLLGFAGGAGAMGPGMMPGAGRGMEGGPMEMMGPPGAMGPGMMPGMGGPGGMGGPMGQPGMRPRPEEDDGGIRRRLKADLVDIQTGLVGPGDETPGGLSRMAKEDASKKMVSSILGPIQNWLNMLEEKDLDDEKLVTALKKSMDTYGTLLKQAAPSSPPGAPAAPETEPAEAETATAPERAAPPTRPDA